MKLTHETIESFLLPAVKELCYATFAVRSKWGGGTICGLFPGEVTDRHLELHQRVLRSVLSQTCNVHVGAIVADRKGRTAFRVELRQADEAYEYDAPLWVLLWEDGVWYVECLEWGNGCYRRLHRQDCLQTDEDRHAMEAIS